MFRPVQTDPQYSTLFSYKTSAHFRQGTLTLWLFAQNCLIFLWKVSYYWDVVPFFFLEQLLTSTKKILEIKAHKTLFFKNGYQKIILNGQANKMISFSCFKLVFKKNKKKKKQNKTQHYCWDYFEVVVYNLGDLMYLSIIQL